VSSTTISVVLATFNGAPYLAQQLDSLTRQVRPPDELVVGDDGSTDATLDIVHRFRRSSGFPVSVVRNERLGVGTNFLVAAGEAQGRYIAFADQDDVWLPDKLARLLDTLHRHRAVLVAHGVRSVDEQLRPIRTGYPNVRGVQVEERLRGNVWFPIGGNAMLFERTLLDGCDWKNRPSSQWSHDQMNHDDLVKLLAVVRGRTVRIPERLLLYRQHRNNVEGASKTLSQALRTYTDHTEGIEHRINVAADWSRFFSPLAGPEHRSATERYFADAAAIMAARLARLDEPTLRALRSIAGAVIRGDYSRRSADGLEWRWALQDLYSVLPGRNP